MRQSFWKQVNLQESYLSIILGFLVVIVSGMLLYNYFTKLPIQQQLARMQPLSTPSQTLSITPTQTQIAQTGAPTTASQQLSATPTTSQPPTTSPKQVALAPSPSPTKPPQPTTPPGTESAGSYTVQKSDTLWDIADKTYGSGYAWTQIAQANSLTHPGQIEIGQQLTLPAKTVVQGPNPHILSTSTDIPSSHTVAQGESLWTISMKYYGNGYMWLRIAQDNNITQPNVIHPGNVLKLPHPTITLNSTGGNEKVQPHASVAAVVQR